MKSDFLLYCYLSLAFRHLFNTSANTGTQLETCQKENQRRQKLIGWWNLLLISRRSPTSPDKDFAFKFCLLTGLVLEDVHDALLILFCSSVSKQLQAIKQGSNDSLFYVALNYCFFYWLLINILSKDKLHDVPCVFQILAL